MRSEFLDSDYWWVVSCCLLPHCKR